jgi:hypothetical protein
MGTRKRAEAIEAERARKVLAIQYRVGAHVLEMTGQGGRWTTSVDGVNLAPSFGSSADAWTAGVTESDRLDRLAASSASKVEGAGEGI